MYVKTKDNGGLFVVSRPHGRKPTMKPEETKRNRITLGLTDLEYSQLKKLSERKGCSMPDYLRSLIGKEFAQI